MIIADGGNPFLAYDAHETFDAFRARQRQAYQAGKLAWRSRQITAEALQLYETLVRSVGTHRTLLDQRGHARPRPRLQCQHDQALDAAAGARRSDSAHAPVWLQFADRHRQLRAYRWRRRAAWSVSRTV